MADRLQIRRDTAANWTSANPILAQGEWGWELDTIRLKIGDGILDWINLPYFAGGGAGNVLKNTFEYAASNTFTLDETPTDIISVNLNGQELANDGIAWTISGSDVTIGYDLFADDFIQVVYTNGYVGGGAIGSAQAESIFDNRLELQKDQDGGVAANDTSILSIDSVDDFSTLNRKGRSRFYVNDPNRGGLFSYYPSTAPLTPNNGTIFELTDGYAVRNFEGAYNLKWFGCLGNGVADDTEKIQNALNSISALGGGELFVARGIYLSTNLITLPSNVTVRGEGKFSEFRKLSFTTFQSIFRAENRENIIIRDIYINTDLEGNVIFFKNCQNIKVSNVIIDTNLGAGIIFRESSDFVIENCQITGSGANHAITVGTATDAGEGDCENGIIDNCIIKDYGTSSGGLAIDISGGVNGVNVFVCRNIIVSNCVFLNGEGNGIKIQLSEDVIFTNNIIDDVNEIGLILNTQTEKLDRIFVKNNIIKNCNRGVAQLSTLQLSNSIHIIGNSISECDIGIQLNKVERGEAFIQQNRVVAVTAAIEIYAESGDQTSVTISENPMLSAQSAIKGIANKTIIKGNRLQGTSRAIVSDTEELIAINLLLIEGNLIDGSCSSTPVYFRKETIDSLIVTNNFFKNQTSSIAGIYVRNPAAGTGICDIITMVINNNSVEADPLVSTSNAILVYSTTTIGKGSASYNIINSVGGTAISVPAGVTQTGNI